MHETPNAASDIDLRYAVPGDQRVELALALAVEAAASDDASFETEAWDAVRALDAAAGFGTRIAARAVLRRPSDGRFLIFRYPTADGSERYVIPGGGAEPGESARVAAEREVFEETGTHPRDLRPSGLLLYHLLASSLRADPSAPRIQYSPVYVGTIDDELPDTDYRVPCWYTRDEFAALPPRPVTQPLLELLDAQDRGEALEPRAAWLPAN